MIFENCAGGGGRTDIGMVRRFSSHLGSDGQIAPRSFMIFNGMTMALPPEYVDRLLGGVERVHDGGVRFSISSPALWTDPTFGFLHPLGSEPNPLMMERLKRWVDMYKNFVRPFMRYG